MNRRLGSIALLVVSLLLVALLSACSSDSQEPAPRSIVPVVNESSAFCLPALPTGDDPNWTLQAARVKCSTPHLYQVVSHISGAAPQGQVNNFCTPQVVTDYVSAPHSSIRALRFFNATFDTDWTDGQPSVICLVGLKEPTGSGTETLAYSVNKIVTNGNAAHYMFCRDQSGNVNLKCVAPVARYVNVADLFLNTNVTYPGVAYLDNLATMKCPLSMRSNMINPSSSDWLYVIPSDEQWNQGSAGQQQVRVYCYIAINNWILRASVK